MFEVQKTIEIPEDVLEEAQEYNKICTININITF